MLLLKNSVYIRIQLTSASSQIKKVNFNDIKKVKQLKEIFFKKLLLAVKQEFNEIDDKIIIMALKSNLPEWETELEEASARFLYVMTGRFQEYKHFKKVDRGAESPDKSWFNIARKNASIYGFDKRILDELYMIAGDNNW